jgi:hypothetical protein
VLQGQAGPSRGPRQQHLLGHFQSPPSSPAHVVLVVFVAIAVVVAIAAIVGAGLSL